MEKLSVVVSNYNYGRYLRACVDSALALRWNDVEVIVVDDGSTDESLEVLREYNGRLRIISVRNGGQREAVNRGFRESHGDVVIFLDSDDVLPPDMPTALNRVFRRGVSKVQFQMQRIDELGTRMGSPFPAFKRAPSAKQIRRWFLRTSAYPTPPASGNAYARDFLDKIMPLGSEIGEFADSGMLAAAPILGDVETVLGVYVGYRRHSSNDSALNRSPENFFRECERASARWRYACAISGERFTMRSVLRSREVLQFRVAAARMTPGRFLPGDGRSRILLDALLSPTRPGSDGLARRLLISGWVMATLLLPPSLAKRLVVRRFS